MTGLFSPEVINALKPAVNCTKEVFPAQGGVLLGAPFNGLIMLYSCPTFRTYWLFLMAVLEKNLFIFCLQRTDLAASWGDRKSVV